MTVMLPRIRTRRLNAGLLHTNVARPALRSIAPPQTAAVRLFASSLFSSQAVISTLINASKTARSPPIPRLSQHQLRNSSHSTQGSYHSPSSANQTLLSDVPAISPRSLVKYLDTYVVGQTKAKKVLAVGVWNHYLRVASNQRMKEEAELRLVEQQLDQEQTTEQDTISNSADQVTPTQSSSTATTKEDKEPPITESLSRSLRLGKYEKRLQVFGEGSSDKTIQDSWKSHYQIQEERKVERERDPHGEATRNLMFGRSEREWLVNAGGPSAIIEDPISASSKGSSGIVPKFGDDTVPPTRRAVKTPAEEATSHIEQRGGESGGKREEESALAEAASRMHEAVLSDYTPSAVGGEKERSSSNIGIFGADQPLYFSSNTIRQLGEGGRTWLPTAKSSQAGREEELEKKWESPQERAAFAAGLAEERTKRALELARERLSATNADTHSSSTSSSSSSGGGGGRDASAASSSSAATTSQEPPLPNNPTSNHTHPIIPTSPASSAGMTESFISSSPGTLPFFEKSNILLLGPSGSGKTLLLRTLAQALDVPFVHVDATPLTMAGYVGEDVESIIQRLLVQAGWDVNRAQRGIVCIDEIDKLRRTGRGGGAGAGGNGRDVGGEGVQQALLRILEGTVIQVADKNAAAAVAQAQGGGGRGLKSPQEQAGYRLGEGGEEKEGGLGAWYNHRRGRMSGGGGGGGGSANAALSMGGGGQNSQQTATFNVDTSSILFVLSGAFVGIEDVIRKRISPSSLPSTSSPPPATAGTKSTPTSTPKKEPTTAESNLTQTDLLNRLEPVDLEQYGLIPEFIGRVPISVVLNPLSFEDLVRVMTEPKNSLVDQYTSLFKLNGIELHISPGAIEEVVMRAMGSSPSGGVSGGGARGLRRIMEEILLDAFYESYGSSSVKYILLDRQGVKQGGVKLFSRGQKFDFESQIKAEAEDKAKGQVGVEKKKDGKKKKEQGGVRFSPQRLKAAKMKARAMVRARFRVRNRLSDPVIYI